MPDDRVVRISARNRLRIVGMQARRKEAASWYKIPTVSVACLKRNLICNEIRGLSWRNLWETARFLIAVA